MMTIYTGGDPGGPSCTKIELPENWASLVEEYRDYARGSIAY